MREPRRVVFGSAVKYFSKIIQLYTYIIVAFCKVCSKEKKKLEKKYGIERGKEKRIYNIKRSR